MRQRLGAKKHKKCEQWAGKKYISCSVRGGSTHFLAMCWLTDSDCDYVNYKTGEVYPAILSGKFVKK